MSLLTPLAAGSERAAGTRRELSRMVRPVRAVVAATVALGVVGAIVTVAQMALLSHVVAQVFLAHSDRAQVAQPLALDRTGSFFEPLWTDFFNPGGATPGILDWYTVLIGLLALAVLTAHGANWIALKTEGCVRARARRISFRAWLGTLVLTAPGTYATFSLRPTLLQHFGDRPWGVVFPAIALAGLAGMGYYSHVRWDRAAFLSSAAYIAGMLAATAFALYPAVLPAVVPAYSLTVHNASASPYGLSVGLVWWCMAIALAASYFILNYRLFRGRVAASRESPAG